MNENLKTLSKLLGDFSGLIDNRSPAFLFIFEEPFSKILNWHFRIWKREYLYLGKQNEPERWSAYDDILRKLDAVFQKIGQHALKDMSSFSFFKKFKKHVEEHKKEVVEIMTDGEKRSFSYADYIIGEFYRMLFENAPYSRLEDDIWGEPYFPKEWKVTKENLQDKNNIIAQVSLNNFLFWAQDRIRSSNSDSKTDFDLDNVASNLFPSVSPPLWAKLLTFLMRSWGDNRMKSLVELGTNFGFASRPMFGVIRGGSEKEFLAQMGENVRAQERSTLELAALLFPHEFRADKLDGYLADLLKLRYDTESMEDGRRKDFISIFQNMKSISKEQINPQGDALRWGNVE